MKTLLFLWAFGFWFLIQLFSQVGAVAAAQTVGVAYMAHVGGFIFWGGYRTNL